MNSSILTRRLNPAKTLLLPYSTNTPTFHFHSRTANPPQSDPLNLDSSTVFQTLSCYNNDWKRALDFFNWVETESQFQHTTETYNRMIDILGVLRSQKRFFMIESGVCPRMDTYVMLMRKFGRWGFLRPVFLVWKKMEKLGCSPDEFAYNALIDALIQKGMVDMARKYEEEMMAKGLSAKPRVELDTTEEG
ncbi:hypothetical protein NC651_013600 [Populus alba x Populus x berolinensis]|nr:hypothetical protein NC651_013600 [Populus alba x Populus x berolinensis]